MVHREERCFFFKRLKWKYRKKKHIRDFGLGNKIYINEKVDIKWLKIDCFGNNNKIFIDTAERFVGSIFVGTRDCPCSNCKVIISKGTTSNGIMIRLMDNNSSFYCGEDCMFSDAIQVWCSDTHTITDLDGKINNYGKKVNIGNHVWIGTGVRISKNTSIADRCIVGMGSVVSGDFIEENCVIAGNPAKIVKRNLEWNRMRPNDYVKKTFGQRDSVL